MKAVSSPKAKTFMIHADLCSLFGKKGLSSTSHLSCLFTSKSKKRPESTMKHRMNSEEKNQNTCDITKTSSPLKKSPEVPLRICLRHMPAC